MKNCSKKESECPNTNPQPLDCFNKNKTMKDGYAYECKECMRIYRKLHRKTEKHKISRSQWDKNNPDSVESSKKKYYNKTKDKWGQYNKDYYQENRVDIRTYQNKYYFDNNEKMRVQQKERRNKKPILYTYNDYKFRSKKKGLEFNLSLEGFSVLVCSKCHYCDQLTKVINGVDRVNNDIGYVLENCVTCCKICNTMKMDLSYENFLKHVLKISNRFNSLPTKRRV